jgi:hypothetical protein
MLVGDMSRNKYFLFFFFPYFTFYICDLLTDPPWYMMQHKLHRCMLGGMYAGVTIQVILFSSSRKHRDKLQSTEALGRQLPVSTSLLKG